MRDGFALAPSSVRDADAVGRIAVVLAIRERFHPELDSGVLRSSLSRRRVNCRHLSFWPARFVGASVPEPFSGAKRLDDHCLCSSPFRVTVHVEPLRDSESSK